MNLLSRAIASPNLNDAVLPIQKALGITDGDVAANCFSSFQSPTAWGRMPIEQRKRWIGQWLRMEALHA